MKILGIILLIVWPLQLAAQSPESQSLSQALRQAYRDNPTLNAARRELRVVNEQLPQALAGWRPTLELGLGVNSADIDTDPITEGDGGTEKEASLSLNQPLYRGGSTTATVRAAKAVIRAQQQLLLGTQQQILSATVEAYMNVVRDQALLALSRKNRELIAKQLQATNDRFDQGSVTKTDVKQAEARQAGADADIIRLSGQLDSSLAVYKQVVGVVPVNFSGADILPPLPNSLENSLTFARDNSPDITAARELFAAQENNIDAVAGELGPQINLSASRVEQLDPQPGLLEENTESVISLNATIPLYQAGSVRSRVREATEEAMRRRIQITEAERAVEQQVISSWRSFQAAKAETLARKVQVEAATIAREGVYIEAAEGGRTVLDTLDADQELLDAQVDEVISQRDQVVAAFNLAAVLGILTPPKLGFPEDTISIDK